MVLGIESSCDESALALFDPARGIVGEWVHSQFALHAEYGGVVPDLASREHLTNFPFLVDRALEALDGARPEVIAVTYGPGLAGCLAMGVALAKSLALAWSSRLVGVNHLRGHAFSPFMDLYEQGPADFGATFTELLPHLGLIVSGGNSMLFAIDSDGGLVVMAQTVDDAAGEALDKGAKLLGLGYPGGPLIEELAIDGDRNAFAFPRAFYHSVERKFSFSGLKTSLRYCLEAMGDETWSTSLPDLCASYQEAVVDALARKARQVLKAKDFPFASLGVSGGVANNRRLRAVFEELAANLKIPLHLAKPRHSGDNAAMIAFASHVNPSGTTEDGLKLSIDPSLELVGG